MNLTQISNKNDIINENYKKILIPYVFHIYNNRVKYFFKFAIFESNNVDFLIICNDKNIQFEQDLPKFNNVFSLKRDNIGFDFGAWSDGILTNNLYKNYTHFIFCNSSIVGPFLPQNFQGKWIDVYLNGLNENNCKLFGSTINTIKIPHVFSHVQSYIFSLNLETLEYLIEEEIFRIGKYAVSLRDAIISKEILMSAKVLDKGWNIGCLLKIYKNVDFTLKSQNENFNNIFTHDDLMFEKYMGTIWNADELIFIKGNRICTNVDQLIL